MRYAAMLLTMAMMMGCVRATPPANLPTQSVRSTAGADQSGAKPEVLSFTVITSEGTYEASTPGRPGAPPRGVVTNPRVKLHATVQNAEAVRFVISSIVGKDGPIEQLGAIRPDASGNVEVDWQLSRPGFSYSIYALAVSRPAAPPAQGDMVDAMGNLAGASGAVRLELAAGK